MKKVLIIQNCSREGPGLFARELKKYEIAYDIVDLDQKVDFPDDVYQAIIVLGGPDSVNDWSEKIRKELIFLKKKIQNQVPFLGICLGMQLLAKIGGSEVIPAKTKEVGFKFDQQNYYEVNLTDKGKKDFLFHFVPHSFPVFQLHGETVEPFSNIHLLAQGSECFYQAIKYRENAYGLQFHMELTESLLKKWLHEDHDLKQKNYEKILDEYHHIKKDYQNIGKTIIRNFLAIADLI